MEILGTSIVSLVTGLVGALVFFVLAMVFVRTLTKWIVKVPSDKALIVYGVNTKSTVTVLRRIKDENASAGGQDIYTLKEEQVEVNFKIVRGGAVLVIPALHEAKWLDLDIMPLELMVEDVLSSQAVPITVDGIAQVRIGGDMVYIATAAEQLLGKTRPELEHVAEETLKGHLRAIIGQMTVEDAYKDREQFSNKVQEVAVEDLAGMGLEIKSFVIKDIDDKQGYINALGAKEVQAKLRDEQIAKAEADRESRVRKAEADLAAQTAELLRDKQVFEKKEETGLREVEKDKRVALAQQQKDREVAEQQALAVAQKKQAEVIVPAEAEARAKRITAEGEQQRIEITAVANAKAAETTADGTSKATKLTADATAESTRKTKTAEADGQKAILLATAEGTRAQLMAQADGEQKLAEARSAQGEINLRQVIAEAMIAAEVQKAQAYAAALAGIGEKVRIVQLSGGSSNNGNPLMDLLMSIPEVATVLNEKTMALSEGSSIQTVVEKVLSMLRTAGKVQDTDSTYKGVADEHPGRNPVTTPVNDQPAEGQSLASDEKKSRRRPGSKSQ